MFYATTTKNCLPKKNVCVSAEENGERRTETDASGGEFPNREFPRSGIDGNSSGIPFSKIAFSGNSEEFPYRGGILALQGDFYLQGVLFYLQGGVSSLRHQINPYSRLQNQKRTGAKSGHSGPV